MKSLLRNGHRVLASDLNMFNDICMCKCELDLLIETMYAHTNTNVYLLCFNAMMTKYDL